MGLSLADIKKWGLLRGGASKQKAFDALVSGDGNVTSAALPTLVGTPGQVIRLSDGDDKGALLIWAVPAGASSYTWCWWLWPQSAYF